MINIQFNLTINPGDDAATDIAAAFNTELTEDLPGLGSPFTNTSGLIKVITGVLEEQQGSTTPSGAFTIAIRSSTTNLAISVTGP